MLQPRFFLDISVSIWTPCALCVPQHVLLLPCRYIKLTALAAIRRKYCGIVLCIRILKIDINQL